MATSKKRKPEEDWSWPLIILCLCFIWPLGLLLLFNKLFGSDEQKAGQEIPPLWEDVSSAGQAASRFAKNAASAAASGAEKARKRSKAAKAVKKVTKSPKVKKSNAWLLKLAGLVLLFFGLGGMTDAVESMLWAFRQPEFISLWWLEDLLGGCAFTVAGLAMLVKGFTMDRQLKRFSRYLLVMGDQDAVSVDELARTLGYSERRVGKDLEKMIDRGYFGGKAYLNVELGYLFRDGAEAGFRQRFEEAAKETAVKEPPPQEAAPKEAEEGYSGILRNIRRANDQIADPILSAKIDRLEEITAKIFRAVEEDPRKADRIGTFLNYYLPTTQKLLDSYAQFEAAGVEGENLRQAKQRIENTMDSIVKGFEHQLDELYKADAMDVDSDIRVMEHMLRRDIGSAEQDFGLGGSAAQAKPEDE